MTDEERRPHIMELIARAPWREAVTCRDRRDLEIRRGDTGKRDD